MGLQPSQVDERNLEGKKRKWLAWAYLLLTDSDTATNTYFVTDSACNCQLHSRPYQPPTTSSFLADCQGLGKFYFESGGNIQQSLRMVTNYKIRVTNRINAETPSWRRSAERIKYKKHPTSNLERPTSDAGQFRVFVVDRWRGRGQFQEVKRAVLTFFPHCL